MSFEIKRLTAPVFNRPRLDDLLANIRGLRIAVIGDFTLDGYWHTDMTRSLLSRETPLFPRPVVRETYSPGGAANVAWNLADLKVGKVQAFTVFGPDWRGELFGRVLTQAGIDQEHVLVQPDRFTPFYGKVILAAHGSQQEDARLDFINTAPIADDIQHQLLARLEASLQASRLDAVVVADYQANGVITPRVREGLNHLAASFPNVFFLVDSREEVGGFHHMVIKPNDLEATRLFYPAQADGASAPLADLFTAAMARQEEEGRPLCITLGSQGCLLCLPEGAIQIPAIPVPPPLDTVGAGDTFLAGLAAGLAAGGQFDEAAQLAILAASVIVRKLHVTGTASPDEITATFDTYLG